MKRDYRIYLDDILEAVKRIEKYSARLDFALFCQDDMAVDAVVRNFEVIGEAAKISRSAAKENTRKYRGEKWQACETSSYMNILAWIFRYYGRQLKRTSNYQTAN